MRPRRVRVLAASAAAALVTVACARTDVTLDGETTGSIPSSSTTTTAVATAPGADGTAGVGDPYFPGLGNGGYDVVRYDLAIGWFPDTGVIEGVATIELRGTADVGAFNLDLVGLEVSSIRVNDVDVDFSRDGRELTIEHPLSPGAAASVVVAYAGVPEAVAVGTDLFELGWNTDGRDAFVVSEPAGAANWFPSNDHPTDKALFGFAITVPDDLAVVASGVLQSMTDNGPRSTWVYESADLMATYLASVVIGDLVFDESIAPTGTPIRNAYPARLAEKAKVDFARAGEMIGVFEQWFGPYPFEVYGQVVVDENLGFALENQTLSLFGSDLATGAGSIDAVVAHELAHQWVGNAVTLSTWRDIWLNEGFATYAEWIWDAESGGPSIEESAERTHQSADFGIAPGDPGPEELFQPTVYLRGGLVLHALSVEIGDTAFRQILREWVVRHDDSAASTADFASLAEEISGLELDAFFDAWVYGVALPELP